MAVLLFPISRIIPDRSAFPDGQAPLQARTARKLKAIDVIDLPSGGIIVLSDDPGFIARTVQNQIKALGGKTAHIPRVALIGTK